MLSSLLSSLSSLFSSYNNHSSPTDENINTTLHINSVDKKTTYVNKNNFAFDFVEGQRELGKGASIYANSPFPDGLSAKFQNLGKTYSWAGLEGSPYPYITEIQCHNCDDDTIALIKQYLQHGGWHQVQMYELEYNTFNSIDKEDGITLFECISTGRFSGIPRDTPGYDSSYVILRSHPSQKMFTVPTIHANHVRDVLLSLNWHHNQ